jgi:glycosyltransferase 2 family protein
LYGVLALKPIGYGKTLLIQISSAFVNRLLPAGFGAISLNVAYLRRQRHSYAEAAAVVAVNNLLGIVGHLGLMVAAVLLGGVSLGRLKALQPPLAVLAVAGAVLAGLLLLALWPKARAGIASTVRLAGKNLRAFRNRPRRLVIGFVISLLLTLTYVGILAACATAFGVGLSLAKVFIVFSAGALLGTATPTPGGVVGAEAGLVAGFAAYGLPADKALAVALLYRFLTYWLPLVPGCVAFVVAQRRLQLIR